MQANRKLFVTLGLIGVLAGCSSMSDTERRTLSGTAIGTAGGAVIGGATGKPLTGAAIGAAAGTAGGYLYDRHEKKKDD